MKDEQELLAPAAVVMRQLGYRYEDEWLPALLDVTLEIASGEFIAVIGASGSGKSTLCQLLNGTLSRSGSGERTGGLTVYGMDPDESDIASAVSKAGVVLQDPDAQLVQGVVEDEVAFGPENLRVAPVDIEHRLASTLADMGLSAERRSSVRRLSGGQRQRTAIAAVLALDAPLVVFDDAAAQLDPPARRDFVGLCRRLHAAGRTVITASGRMDETARAAQRVVVLAGGSVLLDGPPDVLLREQRARLAALGLLPSPLDGEGRPVDVPGAYIPGTKWDAGRQLRPARTPDGVSPQAEPLLEVKALAFTYPGSSRTALDGVSLTLGQGERIALLGENGSGKTTLSKLLMGLLPAPKGHIWWKGLEMAKRPVHELATEIGYVFQQPEHQFIAATVWEECLYSVRIAHSLRADDPLPEADQQRAEQLLSAVGLHTKRDRSPYLLSGGEKRLLSAVAQFILPKQLYILDEPTAGTDYIGTEALIRLCMQQAAEGASLLVITHDVHLAGRIADRTLHMEQGRLTNYTE